MLHIYVNYIKVGFNNILWMHISNTLRRKKEYILLIQCSIFAIRAVQLFRRSCVFFRLYKNYAI